MAKNENVNLLKGFTIAELEKLKLTQVDGKRIALINSEILKRK